MSVCFIIASQQLSPGCAADIMGRAPGGFVICADAGLVQARAYGIQPDLVLGDFDSLGADVELPAGRVLRYAAEKDDTDGMLAVKEGLERGFREFEIYGGLGGRLDHTLGNLCALRLIADHGGRGWLRSDDNSATLLRRCSALIARRDGFYISLVPLFGRCEGVRITGVRYPLGGVLLDPSATLGISNEFASEQAEVSVTSGDLLIVLSRK